MNEAIGQGHFAQKQIFCSSKLIAWSHRRRFEIALQLARPFAGKVLLDYGCGDGTFLAMLMNSAHAPATAMGAEIDERQVSDLRQRFAHVPNLRFFHLKELAAADHVGRYDAVFCMEVLEHVVEVEPVLNDFARTLAPAGCLFISVPVEIGFPILLKQVMRRIAGWRGLGDYPGTSTYTWSELWASLTAGSAPHIDRPIHRHADGTAFHDHKGFNWLLLREQVARRFQLRQKIGSPLTWVPPAWASQVWLVAEKRQ